MAKVAKIFVKIFVYFFFILLFIFCFNLENIAQFFSDHISADCRDLSGSVEGKSVERSVNTLWGT